jgi:hypothetical protein
MAMTISIGAVGQIASDIQLPLGTYLKGVPHSRLSDTDNGYSSAANNTRMLMVSGSTIICFDDGIPHT